MIEFKTGDIFSEDAEALVNTVNCVGVMGRGVALQFKRAYPKNFKAYAECCKRNELQPGQMFVFDTGELTNPRYIINFPTKRHWKGKSRIEDIESGLGALVKEIESRGIRSIALPPLGSGLGGLPWPDVQAAMQSALKPLEGVRIIIFEPGGGPLDARANRSRDVPKMTLGRAALVALMERYIEVLLDPFVTLLEVHKLMYFLQEAGEPLKLRFVKGVYGPYAENLRHVLNAMEGHLVSGYVDGGDRPGKPIELVPGATKDAKKVLKASQDTQHRLERVFDLVEGFESSFGLELLATVHWVAREEGARNGDEIPDLVYAWSNRKRQFFSRRQIGIAVDVLSSKGWFSS